MRLSDWQARAPQPDSMTAKVLAPAIEALALLGAGRDPDCWVAWGEDPSIRYTILVPTEPGLISSFVRINVPGEGPRATTKLIRWSRVSIGELTVETQAGHRLLSFQVEQLVLRGADEEADRVAAFALRVIAAIDGRTIPPDIERKGRPASRKPKAAARPTTRSGGPTRSAGTGALTNATATKAIAAKTGRAASSTATARAAARGSGR